MKTILLIVVLILSCSVLTLSDIGAVKAANVYVGTFHFKAWIDGTDNVYIQNGGGAVWIVNQTSQLPSSITIDGVSWSPTWSGSTSSKYTSNTSHPIYQWTIEDLTIVSGRGSISIAQNPSSSNNYTANVVLNDYGWLGAAWYEFELQVEAAIPTIESCGASGAKKDLFAFGENVYANGSGYAPSTTYGIYLVNDVTTWTNGMSIPSGVSGSAANVTTDQNGNIPVAPLWTATSPGKYDIMVDTNCNGKYDAGIDALDDNETQVTAGFFVISPPTAATVSVNNTMKKTLNLTWTASTDPYFARYEVYRSLDNGVLGTLISNITSNTTIRLMVTGLSPATKYYFTVRVWDTVGLYADVQVNATTLPPPAAVMASAINVMRKSFNLTWTANNDPEFAQYEIFQSTAQGVLGTSIANVTSKMTTKLGISALSPGTTYYFTVRVRDTEALYADSTQISIAMVAPPTAVTASVGDVTENSLKVTWTQTTDPFFAKYQIFQSNTPGQLGTLVATVTNVATTSQTITGLSSGTTYSFTIRVVDAEGLYADSTQQNVTTAIPSWQQPLFIGSIVAAFIVAAAAAIIYTRKKGASGTT
jgi:hypothetical protein